MKNLQSKVKIKQLLFIVVCFSFLTCYAPRNRGYQYQARQERIQQTHHVRALRSDFDEFIRQELQDIHEEERRRAQEEQERKIQERQKLKRRHALWKSTLIASSAILNSEELKNAQNSAICMICKDSQIAPDGNLKSCAMHKTACCKQALCATCRDGLFEEAHEQFNIHTDPQRQEAYINAELDSGQSTVILPETTEELNALEAPKCPQCRSQPLICESFLPKMKEEQSKRLLKRDREW